MDEVEDLQGQIALLQAQIGSMSTQLAEHEFTNSALQFSLKDSNELVSELQEKLRQLRAKDLEPLQEASSLADSGSGMHQGSAMPQSLQFGNLTKEEAERKLLDTQNLLDTQCENENLRWELSVLQLDSAHLVQELQKALSEVEESKSMRQSLEKAEKELVHSNEVIRKLKEDSISRSQEELKQDQ